MLKYVFKVMVSSTFRDLREYRDAVRDAVESHGMLPLRMEADSAIPDRGIITNSLAKVDDADGYIVLISNYRYGQVIEDKNLNPKGLSVTELEFERAEKNGLPICIYLMDENVPVSPVEMRKEVQWQDKLAAFRARAQHPARITANFKTPDDLKTAVVQTLTRLKSVLEQRHATERQPAPLSHELYVREPTPGRHRLGATVDERLKAQGWRIDKLDLGKGCTRPDFNARLVVDRPLIRVVPLNGKWAADEYYSPELVTFVLAELGMKSGEYTNDSKVRIASDFVGQETVDIQETDYISSLMTDQFGWDQVRSKAVAADFSPESILRGVSSFIEPHTGRLMGFGENRISNQLGASTLAFSDDGFLMIVDQNDRNLQSQNLLAPSGSGSLDWCDVTDSGASDLLALVRYGANRELQEECALDPDGSGRVAIASDVMVIGFARMLHRAGKPEFFCLGYIGAPAEEIRQRTPERFAQRVDVAQVGRANWQSGRPRDEISRICHAYLTRQNPTPLSYPLEHALTILIDLCDDSLSGPVVDDFIRQHAL